MNDSDKVLNFINKTGYTSSTEMRLLDIASEVGEVAKEVLKSSSYGKTDFSITESFIEELGDLYFSLLCLAAENQIDLSKELDKILAKYNRRIEERNSMGSV